MMRRLLLLFSFLAFTLLLQGQGIDFFEGDYKAAFKQAYDKDKLVFVDAYAVWCGPCKRMSKQVFPQEEVGDFFNSNFVNMKIDMEKGQGLTFRKTYPVSAFPTFFFIDGEGNVVYKFKGARDAAGLISEAKKALDNFDNSAKYEQLYADGDRSFEIVYKYIRSLNRAGKSSLKVANDYLLSQDNLDSKESLEFIFEACTEVDSRIFELMTDRKSAIIDLYSEEAFEEKVLEAAQNTFDKSIAFDAPGLEDEALSAVKKYSKDHYKSFKYALEMTKAERIQDTDAYIKSTSKYYKAIKGDTKEEKNIISDLYEGYNNNDALILAKDIAESVARKEVNPENYIMLSRIFVKLDEKEKALDWAQKALTLAGEDKRMSTAIQRFINAIES